MNDYEALLPSDVATSLNDLERAAKALNHIKDVLISKEDELDEHEN